jgi:putative spermidine/putrescine transport system permease protein
MTRRGPTFDILLSAFVLVVCVYLVLPTIAIAPISFSETDFIIFPPKGFSFRWYQAFFEQEAWRNAAATSFTVAAFTTLLATVIGTLAALGLRRLHRGGARLAMSLILLPMIVPTIITAVAFYGAFARLGLVGTVPGLVVAHTILALPFVVINVSAVIQKVDWRIVDAARSMGASPAVAFSKVTLPALLPGILAGAVFAFLTSFDEIVISLFIAGVGAVTLPVQMWSGIRFEISPVVAAASCLLLLLSLFLLTVFWLLKRR